MSSCCVADCDSTAQDRPYHRDVIITNDAVVYTDGCVGHPFAIRTPTRYQKCLLHTQTRGCRACSGGDLLPFSWGKHEGGRYEV